MHSLNLHESVEVDIEDAIKGNTPILKFRH